MRLVPVQPQQVLVEFADGLQGLLCLAITLQSLAYLRDLFRTQTQLAGLCASVVDIEDPLRMPLAARALGTAIAVKGSALEERAAQDIAARMQCGGKFIPFLGGAFTCHLLR